MNKKKKLGISFVLVFLLGIAVGTTVVQYYFPNIGKISGQLEDPREAWSEADVIIWQYNSTPYYACRNMSTNMVAMLQSSASTVIQYAVDNCKNVYIKGGSYSIDAAIQCNNNTHDNLRIELAPDAVLTLANSVNNAMWRFQGYGTTDGVDGTDYIANITFIGGVLNGNGFNNQGNRGDGYIYDNDCIWCNFIEDSTFEGVFTTHSWDRGISIRNGRRNLIDNCIHRTSDAPSSVADAPDGFIYAYGHDNVIRDSKVYNCTNDAINLYGEHNSLIDACYSNNCTGGTAIDGSATVNAYNNHVVNSVYDGCGCPIAFSTNTHDNVVGEGCGFFNSTDRGALKGYGVWLGGTRQTVKGGLFANNSQKSIECDGNNHTIKDCIFIYEYDCIHINTNNIMIQDCQFYEWQHEAIFWSTGRNITTIKDCDFVNTRDSSGCIYDYYATSNISVTYCYFSIHASDLPISFASGSNYLLVEHNEIVQGASPRITAYGSGSIVRWNTGYKTEANGITINSVDGSTVATGLVANIAWLMVSCNITGVVCTATYSTTTITLGLMWGNGTAVDADHSPCSVYWYAQTWNYP